MDAKLPQPASKHVSRKLAKERFALLRTVDEATRKPVAVLGIAWLILVIIALVWGTNVAINFFTSAIWVIFIADFVLRLIIAPKKTTFLRRNALTAISLILPALAVLRLGGILSLFPTSQVALLRLVSSLNRTFNAFATTMERRGFAYVILIVVTVVFAGAAGMLSFERDQTGSPMSTYGYALWWTSMIMTTMGSDYFPHSIPGRILCLLLSIFAFSIFGYLTGAISSYFINKDASDASSPIPDADQLRELTDEVRALRAEVAQLRAG